MGTPHFLGLQNYYLVMCGGMKGFLPFLREYCRRILSSGFVLLVGILTESQRKKTNSQVVDFKIYILFSVSQGRWNCSQRVKVK